MQTKKTPKLYPKEGYCRKCKRKVELSALHRFWELSFHCVHCARGRLYEYDMAEASKVRSYELPEVKDQDMVIHKNGWAGQDCLCNGYWIKTVGGGKLFVMETDTKIDTTKMTMVRQMIRFGGESEPEPFMTPWTSDISVEYYNQYPFEIPYICCPHELTYSAQGSLKEGRYELLNKEAKEAFQKLLASLRKQ